MKFLEVTDQAHVLVCGIQEGSHSISLSIHKLCDRSVKVDGISAIIDEDSVHCVDINDLAVHLNHAATCVAVSSRRGAGNNVICNSSTLARIPVDCEALDITVQVSEDVPDDLILCAYANITDRHVDAGFYIKDGEFFIINDMKYARQFVGVIRLAS